MVMKIVIRDVKVHEIMHKQRNCTVMETQLSTIPLTQNNNNINFIKPVSKSQGDGVVNVHIQIYRGCNSLDSALSERIS